MPNSIDINLSSGNNSMKPLSFTWIALFKDNAKIEQYGNNIEHKFQEVQEKISELAYFNLTDKKGHFFTVDLINGRIGYNYLPLPYLEKTDKQNIRLIFFRRHKVEMTEKMIEKSHTIDYHLGYQYLDKNGYNQKIIIIIDKNGSWSLGE
jgi:L-ribulose-5-phosphate 3-epimerase UlaE